MTKLRESDYSRGYSQRNITPDLIILITIINHNVASH